MGEDVLRSPMYLLPVSLKVKEKPQKNHWKEKNCESSFEGKWRTRRTWKETTAIETMLDHIMESAFFLRKRPE